MWKARAEHENGPAAANAANGLGFREVRDAKYVGAALHEQRGDLFETMAVSVRFHDRDNLRLRAEPMANPRQVSAQRGKIHFSPTPIIHAG